MGNATIVVVVNGKKVNCVMKEAGAESVGAKVKVVTVVIYDIIANCKGLLKTGQNELVIKGYDTEQQRIF